MSLYRHTILLNRIQSGQSKRAPPALYPGTPGQCTLSARAVRVHCTRSARVQCTLGQCGYNVPRQTVYNAGIARFVCPDCLRYDCFLWKNMKTFFRPTFPFMFLLLKLYKIVFLGLWIESRYVDSLNFQKRLF